MPDIGFDLDAKKKVTKVARALGVPDMQVGWGLLELWEWCWMEKSPTVRASHLQGFFGPMTADPVRALVDFGFLEPTEPGTYLVRGALKRLGLAKIRGEAGAKGGKASAKKGKSKTNLRQFASEGAEATPKQMLRESEANTEATPKPSPFHPFTPPPTTQKEEEAQAPESSGAAALQEVWNRDIPPELPRCEKLTEKRRKAATARLAEIPELPVWEGVVQRIRASDFCRGRNERGWVANFDFLIQPDTATKALEGRYDNRAAAPPQRDWAKGRVGAEEADKEKLTGDQTHGF